MPEPSCARSSSSSSAASLPEAIICEPCSEVHHKEDWWDHIISKEHQQALHRQNVKDPTSVAPCCDSPVQWEPLGIDCSKESPWRESDDDYALDDNNNLVPWSWRARDAATFHAQNNTVNELEHKANLKRFRQEKKYEDRKIAKQIAKEMEEDKMMEKDKSNKVAFSLDRAKTEAMDEEMMSSWELPPSQGGTSSRAANSKELPIPMPKAKGWSLVDILTVPKSYRPWWEDEEEVNARMLDTRANKVALDRLSMFSKCGKPPPSHVAFSAPYIMKPQHDVCSEVYPTGGGIMVQKWFDMGLHLDEGKLILTDLIGHKDYYKYPLTTKDETIVKWRVIDMIAELGVCIEEVCSTLQSAISLHTMVMDNEMGISGGFKKNFLTKEFNKKKVQSVLDYGKMLSMQLYSAKLHIQENPEHPFAPSTTPWRYQQFLKHVRDFFFNEGRDLAKQVQMDYLIEWTGPVKTTNEMSYKWP